MKTLLLTLSLLAPLSSPGAEALKPEEIRRRLEVKTEVFRTDKSGLVLHKQGGETRTSRYAKNAKPGDPLEDNFGSNANDPDGIVMRTAWRVDANGSITVDIEEFGGQKVVGSSLGDQVREPVNSLKKQKIAVENFAPVTWISQRPNANERVVVRLTPSLRDDDTPKALSELPISVQDGVVFDNAGNLWSSNFSADGKFFGLVSNRGAIALSYYPFRGAKAIGAAVGNKIEVSLPDNRTVTILSQTGLLPSSTHAVVYGFVDLKQKTKRIGSVSTYSSNREANFLESLGK